MGFRTPAGRLTTTQSFKTIGLPRLVRGKPGAWDPQICLHWGQHFISSLRSLVASEADPNTSGKRTPPVWRISFKPKEGVHIRLLDEDGVREVVGEEDRVGFLPPWFFDLVSGATCEHAEPTSHPPPADRDDSERIQPVHHE